MTKQKALAQLRKLLGKNLAYNEYPDALVGEAREENDKLCKRLREARAVAAAAVEKRRVQLLGNDPEYQAAWGESLRIAELHKKAIVKGCNHRIEVGTAGSLIFTVHAQADNWHEAVERVQLRKEQGWI